MVNHIGFDLEVRDSKLRSKVYREQEGKDCELHMTGGCIVLWVEREMNFSMCPSYQERDGRLEVIYDDYHYPGSHLYGSRR